MVSRKLTVVFLAAALTGAAAWYGWRWHTTPAPPDLSLDGVAPALRESVEKAAGAVRRQPRSAKAWGELCRLLIANGLDAQALPCLVQVQRLDPREPCWPYLHGSVALLLAKPREGIPKLREALTLTDAAATGDAATDAADARHAEARHAILFLLATALIEDGQLDEAEQRLRELGAAQGQGARLHFGLGLLARARDDRPAARKHLSVLADHPCARKQVCFLLASLTPEDEKLADSYRSRAAGLPPDVPWPCSYDEEVRNYRVAAPLDRYHELAAAGRPEAALDYLRQAAAQAPDEETCYLLGIVLLKSRQFDEAEAMLRRSLEFNAQNMRAHLYLGAALIERGERLVREPGRHAPAMEVFRQAVAAEDKALALQSDVALAHLIRGRALKALGRPDEALAALRKATLAGPDLPEAHQLLGEVLAEAGQWDEAFEHLENAVRVAPLDPRPRQALEKWRLERLKGKPSN